MNAKIVSRAAVLAAAVFAATIIMMILGGSALAAGSGQVIVELQDGSSTGITTANEFPQQSISGSDRYNKKEYKFQRAREGRNFSYVVANLVPLRAYRVELSFVEHEFTSSSKRIFNVYVQSMKVLNKLDVFSRAGGRNRAYQRTFSASADAKGRLSVQFRSDEPGCRDNAVVSTVRVLAGGTAATVQEVSAAENRDDMAVSVRHKDTDSQDTFETMLGRLGSRLSLNLAPQRLAARFSSLGTGTGDLEDLVLALSDGSKVRCMPFTDRYPVWETITQKQTMTSQSFTCSSGSMPFKVTVRFRAPFYPRSEKVSGAPFLYVDVTVKNTSSSARSGSFTFARPARQEFAQSAPAEFATAHATGVSSTNVYTYNQESTSKFRPKSAKEALAVPSAEAAGVDFRGSTQAEFGDFKADTLWSLASPSGYPDTDNDPYSPLFTYYPRGYTGAVWTINNLGASASTTRHFILAGYVGTKILSVDNRSYSDDTYRFRYRQQFANVADVVEYAVASRSSGDDIEGKSTFFDSTISSNSYLYLSPAYVKQVRDLTACGFQNFLVNTWWTHSDEGRDWFSVWEGSSCRYHSTVDVEYNDSWFYFQYWPSLLKTVMDEWLLYTKANGQGTFLSHDIGWVDVVSGQAYPHDMPVEENADYILLLYKYWKTTGDTAYVKSRFSTVRRLVDFMKACDTNGNGMPDLNTANTLDQGSPALQVSRDQTYLGAKCMAAFQAAREMAGVAGDLTYSGKCRGLVELINQTLEQDSWLSDHFAVCLDGRVTAADREAYNIYAGNGLLYLMGGTRNRGVTTSNTERLAADIKNAAPKTLRQYGSTHSSYDYYNEWVSQSMWRDMAACQLGTSVNGANPLSMSTRYWSLEKYFAQEMNGGFWDVVLYPGGGGLSGASASVEKALGGPAIKRAPATTGDSGGGLTDGAGSPGYRAGVSTGFQQSLGYYPRGATSLGLFESVAGIVLDVPANALYYQPTAYPLRVPVFARADWSSRRVPTLYFSGSGAAPTVTRRERLPGTLAPQRIMDIEDMTGTAHALSPNGDGVNDSVTIGYTLPTASAVEGSVWDGTSRVRSLGSAKLGAGRRSFTWDGKFDDGSVAPDGVYTGRVDAGPSDKRYSVRPASSQLWVNNTIPDLSSDWYLAEGFTGHNATGGEFEEYVLIQNPNPEAAAVQVTFMVPGGATDQRSYTVAPNSRFTITVDDILPDSEVSTYVHADRRIAVERAMYFNGRRAGHDSTGVTCPGKTWYLAEGYTAQAFDEYVLIQNPGEQTAKIDATFMTPNMGNVKKGYSVGPHSRFTIHVNEFLPDREVSTQINASAPVVVERAQYLNSMTAGTDSIAAASTSRTWFLAEGYTDQGFEEYVLVQNPGSTSNNITVTFMDKSGANTLRNYSLPPACRFTIGVDEILPKSEVSVKVRAQHPVLVERAMYWNNRSDGHACIGTPTPDTQWYLPEGYTAQGFETWLLVQNPGDETRNVTFTFMENSGRNTVKTYQVAPRSRFTVGVNQVLPASEVSTRVSADGPIIAERAVYFNNRSGGTDSLGIRGY